MIIYDQKTGNLSEDKHQPLVYVVGHGYSGRAKGLNNPAMEDVPTVGPIPKGLYRIGRWFDDPHHGPVVTRLTPEGHNAQGRSGFMIHGDNKLCNHTASMGCIILNHETRAWLKAMGAQELKVV